MSPRSIEQLQHISPKSRLNVLATQAKQLQLSKISGFGCQLEITDQTLAASQQLTLAVEKILNEFHLVPEILTSCFWSSLNKEAKTWQHKLCEQFIHSQQPIRGRVRVDCVVNGYDNGKVSAAIVEFEPHAGDDMLVHAIREVYDQADYYKNDYLELLCAGHMAQTPDRNGRLRVVQWPGDQRADIDYHPAMENLFKAYRNQGLDCQQYLYEDPAADWQDALVYRIFEFSEIHKYAAQQKIVTMHDQGQLRLANPAFVFGKLVPIFVHEFKTIFQDRLQMTDAMIACFPYTISAQKFLKNAVEQQKNDYRKMYLKGVFSAGSGGAMDVYPLKNFLTLKGALAFIHEKINDEYGGWILQEEVSRHEFTLNQRGEASNKIFTNTNAGVLQRQIFINGKLLAHYNIASSRHMQTSRKIHAEEGVAIFI